MVEKLLESRADANAVDRRGEAPLHLAAARGDYAVAKLLLQQHGRASLANRLGLVPEDCARARGHVDVVTLLQHREARRRQGAFGGFWGLFRWVSMGFEGISPQNRRVFAWISSTWAEEWAVPTT